MKRSSLALILVLALIFALVDKHPSQHDSHKIDFHQQYLRLAPIRATVGNPPVVHRF